jgi:hypothetical protein
LVQPAAASGVATAEAVVVASEAAPTAFQVGRSVAEVPLAAAELVRLPLGAVELVLSPLPGITVKKGLTNLGAGLTAPFKLAISVLVLPYNVTNSLCGMGDTAPNLIKTAGKR